jgi:geranylgeranyl pyrophosphate synthase
MQDLNILRELIDREIGNMNFSGRLPAELYRPVEYVMSNGGKRFRPVLFRYP